jgi:type VI secretion system protein ImpM
MSDGFLTMAIGLFGKYPLRRDFVVVNLPRQILNPLELWFQSAIAASQQALGRSWRDYYLIHPIWNFRIGRGIAGTDCIGAFAPSVDEVGRYFPLAVLALAEPGRYFSPLPTGEWTAFLATVHERLLSALDDERSPDPPGLIEGLVEPAGAALSFDSTQAIKGGYRWQADDGDAQMPEHLTAMEAMEASADRSHWWTEGGRYVKRQLLSVRGMPDPYLFADMIADRGRPDLPHSP